MILEIREKRIMTKKRQPSQSFADILREWRALNEMTQEQAAEELGVNLRTLQNWESERNTPDEFKRKLIERIICEDS